jgi:hypothetical protein
MVMKEQLLDQVREGMKVFGAAIPDAAIDSVVKRHVYLVEPADTRPPAEPPADVGPADAS